MMPASSNEKGQLALPGPLNTCHTLAPPAPPPGPPVPYPSFAMLNQAKGGTCSSKVKISGKKTVVKGTEISMSTGDEAAMPGPKKGVVSSNAKGACKMKGGSGKVKAEGKGISHVSAQTAHNGSNANNPAGAQVAPSQTKVSVMP